MCIASAKVENLSFHSWADTIKDASTWVDLELGMEYAASLNNLLFFL